MIWFASGFERGAAETHHDVWFEFTKINSELREPLLNLSTEKGEVRDVIVWGAVGGDVANEAIVEVKTGLSHDATEKATRDPDEGTALKFFVATGSFTNDCEAERVGARGEVVRDEGAHFSMSRNKACCSASSLTSTFLISLSRRAWSGCSIVRTLIALANDLKAWYIRIAVTSFI